MKSEIERNADEKALKDFLLDLECLDPLADWTSQFNLFDILKISRTEIRHSNMVGWLLDPNENHGLSDSVLRGFIQYVVSARIEYDDVFKSLLMDLHTFIIQREWRNIDLMAISVTEKFVLCIENKIGTGEHDDQLNRYREIVEKTYPDYEKKYIFLSPDGVESSDPAFWISMSYQTVLDIIENSKTKYALLPGAELLINNYVDTLRRSVVGDEKLAQICAEIYAKHSKALDLIFENKPDRAMDVSSIIRKWADIQSKNGVLDLAVDRCNKTYTRFKTQYMSEVIPDFDQPKSGWKTNNFYFYEIYNEGGNDIYIQLAVSMKDLPNCLKENVKQLNEFGKCKVNSYSYTMPFKSRKIKLGEEFSEEKIFKGLDALAAELQEFENNFKKQNG